MDVRVSVSSREASVGLIALILIGFLLTMAYLLDYAAGQRSEIITGFVNLDGEANIPTWFSSAQLLLAGAILALLVKSPVALPVRRKFVMLMAAGLVALSLDETAYVHEQITIFTFRFEWLPTFADGQGPWIVLYSVAFAAVAYLVRNDMLTVYKTYPFESRVMLLAMAFFAFAAAMEVVSYEFLRNTGRDTLYALEVAVEEWAEMVGGSLLLYGAVRYAIAVHRVGEIAQGTGANPFPGPPPTPIRSPTEPLARVD